MEFVAVINPDHKCATVQSPRYIRNGKYHARTLLNKNFHWSNKDSKDLSEFDWNKQKDIHKLNNWRREILSRVTGVCHPPAEHTVG
jgi:hypothetical protein